MVAKSGGNIPRKMGKGKAETRKGVNIVPRGGNVYLPHNPRAAASRTIGRR